ncbi:threonine/serine exporter family protein [Naumannella sp. ID2617S]|nr:threonine/serine exporter family protein [Naumannella sp. ID2617S]
MAAREMGRRLFGRLTRPLREAVTPPPTAPPPEDDSTDEETREALKILGVAMEVAELLLSSGASANDVTSTALRIARAYGLRGVHADVTYTSIHLSWQRRDREPVSTLRVVRSRTTDFTLLQRVYQLTEQIESGELTVLEARGRFRRLSYAAPPYRRWVIVVANGGVAIGLGLLWQATPIVFAVTFLATCLIDIALRFLARRGVPTFFQQAVGAAIPTSATLAMQWAQSKDIRLFDEIQPTLTVSAGIVLLLAGMSVVGAAQDSIDGFYVTASARAFEVVVLTLGIVTGILVVLRVGTWLGVSVLLVPATPILGPPAVQLLGALVIAGSFAVACHAAPRTVILAALMGLFGWVVQLFAARFGFGVIGASALGATVSAMLACVLGPRLKVPVLALITSAIVPLMPGGMVFRGVLLMAGTSGGTPAAVDVVAGMVTLMTAAGVGMALAAGSSLGTYVTRPITRTRWRQGRRTRR